MTLEGLALIWMRPERDIACLTLLAGLLGFLFTRIFKKRSVGTLLGFLTAQYLAVILGLLHFGAALQSFWLIPGLAISLLSALAGSILVRVQAPSASSKPS